jgi:hypothetical protein
MDANINNIKVEWFDQIMICANQDDPIGILDALPICKNKFEKWQIIKKQIVDIKYSMIQTPYHKEILMQHLLWSAKNCIKWANKFEIPEWVVFICGFLHDLGKPFCIRTFGKPGKKPIQIFKGHAQIGCYLFNEFINIPQPWFDIIKWTIDNHMCCCAFDVTPNGKIMAQKYKNHLYLTAPHTHINLCINLLSLLFASDNMGRLSDKQPSEKEALNHSFEFRDTLLASIPKSDMICVSELCKTLKINNSKIIVELFGLSSSGKSWMANYIKEKLSSEYKIIHVERDEALKRVATDLKIPTDIYIDMYSSVQDYPDGKIMVQNRWVQMLNDALEDPDAKIVIIDSVQCMFYSWKYTVDALTEEAKSTYATTFKIGFYLFPQHQIRNLDNSYIPKIAKLPSYPAPQIEFPDVNTETGKDNQYCVDVGTGNITFAVSIIHRFLDPVLIPTVPPQISMMQLINKYSGLDAAISALESPYIHKYTEYENKEFDISVYTLEYQDGFQTFTAESRDYRGTSVLIVKEKEEKEKYYLLRGTLPVIPDTIMPERDPHIMQYFDSKAWEKYASHKMDWKPHIPNRETTIIALPKYDGSMCNIVFISKLDPIYSIFDSIAPDIKKDARYTNIIENTPLGYFIVGSKGRVFAKDPVQTKILSVIEASYGSLKKFIDKLTTFIIKNHYTNNCITFHFEAIIDIPTPELTVFYEKKWLPFYGFTWWKNDDNYAIHVYKLPYLHMNDYTGIEHIAPIYKFDNWTDYFTFREENYQKLLKGDKEIEPEGYVLWLSDGEKEYPIKDKYPFYYMAHKPNSVRYYEEAKEFEKNPEYALLRERLAKFRAKPSIASLCMDLLKTWIKTIPSLIEIGNTKKHWAIYWKSHINDVDEASNMIREVVAPHYPKLKINLFNIIMKLYDQFQAGQVTPELILKHFED